MKRALVILLACAFASTPAVSADERFAADKPTPLKQLKPGKDDGNAVRFGGSVRLSGQFLVVWERGRKPVYRQVMFFPDAASAALLPRAAGSEPVTEVLLSNREQAAPMLLALPTAQKDLEQNLTGAEGAATIMIRDYRAVVECDHRWYTAQLVSVKRKSDLIVSAREAHPAC